MIRRRPPAGRWLFPGLIALALAPAWLGSALIAAAAAVAAAAVVVALGRRLHPRLLARRARGRAIRGEADGILLGADGRGRPVTLTDEQLSAHGLIVGASGAGKSTTMLALLTEHILRGRPVVAIDMKGSPDFARKLERPRARQVGRSSSGRRMVRRAGTRSSTATRPS